MNYKIGDYVLLKNSCIENFDADDARYRMNNTHAYKIIEVEEHCDVTLYNPHKNCNSYYEIKDLERAVNLEDNPEYFL